MPVGPKRICTTPGCKLLIEPGQQCNNHPRKKWVRKPGTTTERGYGSQWRKIRKQVILRDKGLCQPCAKQKFITDSNEVDHIIPKHQGGTDDIDNLQCICVECHKIKTATTDKINC